MLCLWKKKKLTVNIRGISWEYNQWIGFVRKNRPIHGDLWGNVWQFRKTTEKNTKHSKTKMTRCLTWEANENFQIMLVDFTTRTIYMWWYLMKCLWEPMRLFSKKVFSRCFGLISLKIHVKGLQADDFYRVLPLKLRHLWKWMGFLYMFWDYHYLYYIVQETNAIVMGLR